MTMETTAAAAYQRTLKSNLPEQLILDNIDFVRKILSTMSLACRDAHDRENLESAGILGLVEAAGRFDPSQGCSFKTFAFPRIRGAILDELRKFAPVSQQTLTRIGKIKLAYETLKSPVTPEMLAAESGLTVQQVEECLEAMRFLKPQDWNDFHSEIHSSWKDASDQPGDALEREEMSELLASAIQRLPERERLVLTLYYNEQLTLAEIGSVIGVSESRSSRILAAAKFRLKELVRSKIN